VKSILTILFILVNSLVSAQNLHIGLGVAVTGITVDLKDIDGALRSSKGTKTYFNPVNLLFEIELGKNLALKTGGYMLMNKGRYFYTHAEGFTFNGERFTRVDKNWEDDFGFISVDFPVLLTYKNTFTDKKYGFKLDIGPYMGYIIIPTYIWYDYSKKYYGLCISAGFGTKKWQINSYLLTGQLNISLGYTFAEMIKEKSTTFGINLTRVLHFSKKETNPL
jgi:hypothetical protein